MIIFESLNPTDPKAIKIFKHIHETVLIPAFVGTKLTFNYEKMEDLFLHKHGHNRYGLDCQLHVLVAKDEQGQICGAAHWLSFTDPACAFHLYTSVPTAYRNRDIASQISNALYKDVAAYFGKEVPTYGEIRKEAIRKKPDLLRQLSFHQLGMDYRFMNSDYLNENWIICVHGADKIIKSDFIKAQQRQIEFYEGHPLSKGEIFANPSLRLLHESLAKIPGEYVVAKPYLHEIQKNFLSSETIKMMAYAATPEEFELIKSGNTRTKPKLLIDPATKDIWRLVPDNPADTGYKKGYYVKMESESCIVDCYELSGEKLANYGKKELPPLPAGYTIRSFKLQEDNRKYLKDNEISQRQLYELLTAIGVHSCWWPIEDPAYGAYEYFAKQKINILFDGQKPVGITMWDESKLQTDKSVLGSFLGRLPDEKYRGLGAYLFDWGIKHIVDKGAQQRLLVTSPQDVLHSNNTTTNAPPVKNMYEKRGFAPIGTQTCHRRTFQPGAHLLSGLPDHLSKHNVPLEYFIHPSSSERLGRYSHETLKRRLETAFVSRQ